MPNGNPYLGPPGALLQLPSPAPGYEPVDVVGGVTHELLGGQLRDRTRTLRRWVLSWPAMADADWATLRSLVRLPGPYRYLDPLEPNLLTVNQATGTDELKTVEGFSARTQGVVASDTAQARSFTRSLRWDSSTALGATGRGVNLVTATSVIDATWAAVRVGAVYSFSVYARCSAAVTMQAAIEWRSVAGAVLSTDTGTGVALPTGNWTTRLVCENKTAPASAAYAVGVVQNSATTAGAVSVYLDDPQLEEAAAASTFRLGVGTPLVSVEQVGHNILLGDAAANYALHTVELVLVEVG